LHMYAYRRVYGVDVEVAAVAARGDHVLAFANKLAPPCSPDCACAIRGRPSRIAQGRDAGYDCSWFVTGAISFPAAHSSSR
jgi:hypothetical protein